MKRILIVGPHSYIGSRFQTYLQQWPEQYTVGTLSIRDDAWRKDSLAAYDAVLYAVGIVHQKETSENRPLYERVNCQLAVELAEKAKQEGVRQFIYLSSASVYGVDEGVLDHTTLPAPVNHYGKSKLQAEEYLQSLYSDDFCITLVRPPMVYGDGCKGNYQTLIKIADMMPFFANYPNQRSLISIQNLTVFLKQVIDQRLDGIYFPQDPEYCCTCEMIRQIAKEKGKRFPLLSILNPCVALLRHTTKKGRKAFGNLVYADADPCIMRFAGNRETVGV